MEPLTGRRVLVTGAAGFVGANLVRRLIAAGAEVHALVRSSTSLRRLQEILPQVLLHTADVTRFGEVESIVRSAQPDVVFHLAAQRRSGSIQERQATLQTNVVGTFNLLQATASLPYRCFLHFGSSLEYGVKSAPLTEADPPNPSDFFGATKAAATLLCRQFAREEGRPVVVLRPFLPFGPWDRPARLIPTAIHAALHGGELSLTPPGYRRDWIFVEDLVDGCLLAAEAETAAGTIINLGSGHEHSNEEVVQMIEDLAGLPVRVQAGECPPRPWDRPHWVADVGRARELLGWRPTHSLRSGLEKTIRWYRSHREFYP